jgi:Na+/proline symporter
MDLLISIITALFIFGGTIFGISFIVGKITEAIFHWKNENFSKKQFWQTVTISMLICLIISGMICGGVL